MENKFSWNFVSTVTHRGNGGNRPGLHCKSGKSLSSCSHIVQSICEMREREKEKKRNPSAAGSRSRVNFPLGFFVFVFVFVINDSYRYIIKALFPTVNGNQSGYQVNFLLSICIPVTKSYHFWKLIKCLFHYRYENESHSGAGKLEPTDLFISHHFVITAAIIYLCSIFWYARKTISEQSIF